MLSTWPFMPSSGIRSSLGSLGADDGAGTERTGRGLDELLPLLLMLLLLSGRNGMSACAVPGGVGGKGGVGTLLRASSDVDMLEVRDGVRDMSEWWVQARRMGSSIHARAETTQAG
jgi:hypothetical protein